ncbi:hypothetical protein [Chitinophaga deserti]|uniref:hypothetical protein n=1 Tax=Chitinophaga deserti TaxID=2164099 RepID=UPI000D6CA02D|nr:hypothetical protein [Chitinophaga deserti]
MKKIIALILFAVYLISSTELRELAKLPVLIQHFNEHRELNHLITFTEYLTDHYNNLPHTDNDEERDNQLPFKRVDSNVMFSPVIPATGTVELRKPVIPIASNELFSRNVHFFPSATVSKIWQPPKSGSFLTNQG